MKLQLLLAVVLSVTTLVHAEPPPDHFHQRHSEGWFWYRDPAPDDEKKQEKPEKPKALLDDPTEKRAALAAFDRVKQESDEALKIAVVTGRPHDVERYLRLQKKHIERSSEFAAVAKRLTMTDPTIGMTDVRPAGTTANRIHQQRQREERDRRIARLAKTHGLWFFFRSDCPYCHRFAPILREFSQATGISILPISLDGGGLPDFPQPRVDQAVADELKIEQVPALYLVEPKTRTLTLLGTGLMAEDQLYEHLRIITETPASSNVEAATRFNSRQLSRGLQP